MTLVPKPDLRQCDTGEISCLVCVGRCYCDKYAIELKNSPIDDINKTISHEGVGTLLFRGEASSADRFISDYEKADVKMTDRETPEIGINEFVNTEIGKNYIVELPDSISIKEGDIKDE